MKCMGHAAQRGVSKTSLQALEIRSHVERVLVTQAPIFLECLVDNVFQLS
jgi:hypothetical protein